MTSLEEDLASEDRYLMFVTRNGSVKRLGIRELKNIRVSGIRALTLREDDELIAVLDTNGTENVLLASRDGMAICFRETDVRPTGRTAGGVKGIALREGDICIGAAVAKPGLTVLSVTENGYGKRTSVEEYLRGSGEEKNAQSRGGYGVTNYAVTEKTGKVAGVKVVDESVDVMVISSDGTIICTAVTGISTYGRATQGVRMMRLGEESSVIAIALMVREEVEDADAEAAGEQAVPEAETEE